MSHAARPGQKGSFVDASVPPCVRGCVCVVEKLACDCGPAQASGVWQQPADVLGPASWAVGSPIGETATAGAIRHEAAGTHLPLLRCGFLTHKQPKVSAPCACLTMAAHPSSYTCSQQSIPGVHAWSYNEVICCYDVLGNVCSHWAELQVNACARATCMRTCRMHATVELQIARLHVLPYLRVWSTCMVMQSDHAAQDIFSMLRLPRGSQPAIMHSSHEAPGYCIPQQGRP